MTWTPGPWEWDGPALKAGPGEYVLWAINALSEPTDTKEAIGACGVSAERDANDKAIIRLTNPNGLSSFSLNTERELCRVRPERSALS